VIDLRKERPISIKRAAKVLDVDRRTIERWFQQGLDRIKLGGRVYTSREALFRFASQESHPVPSRKIITAQQRESDAYLAAMGVG
jgi:predicted site-specific integrase-resolvase